MSLLHCVIYFNVKFCTDVLIVVEVIQFEKEKEKKKSIVSICDNAWRQKSNIRFFTEDDILLEDHIEVTRYLARTTIPSLYGI